MSSNISINMSNKKTGIFYFTKNSSKRVSNLKNSLYFLFKNYNHKYSHPIIIMHCGDLDDIIQQEIKYSIREDFRNLISFKVISIIPKKSSMTFDIQKFTKQVKEDNMIDHQDETHIDYINRAHLERFWTKEFHKLISDYDAVIKIDDDVFIEEPIYEDLLKIAIEKELGLLSCLLKAHSPIDSIGMFDYFSSSNPTKKKEIDTFFSETLLENKAEIEKYKKTYKMIFNEEYTSTDNKIQEKVAISYDANFTVIVPSFVNSPKFVEKIEQLDDKYFYNNRWKYSAVLTIISMIFDTSKIARFVFKCSSEHLRYALNYNGKIHTNIPKHYLHTGCISYK
jgi:hypothetical protein